jgi:spore coat protein A
VGKADFKKRGGLDEMERRNFLKLMGGAFGAVFSPLGMKPAFVGDVAWTRVRKHRMRMPRVRSTFAQGALTKFVDSLPIPSVLRPSELACGIPTYNVRMKQFRQRLHSELPPTPVWGYNDTYPGPTFDVRKGEPIHVNWRNHLPTNRYLLPVDPTIHGAESPNPPVRTVVHLHGAKVLPESDGYPEAWFTNGFTHTGPFFTTRTYSYPNDQQATTLWYHDHALGSTRLNVFAGLAGFYLIRDDIEDGLNLPTGQYEIPLMIQDRLFNADGSFLYPVQTPGDPDPRVPPIWIPEFFGDTILVNGKVWPFLEVEPRKYRFRILNAANARFYNLVLKESTEAGVSLEEPGPAFHQIGTDGGFLPAPVQLTTLLMAPAERCDVIIDFSGLAGKFFLLTNDANAPFPDGDDFIPGDVMLFKVTQLLQGQDTSALPASLVPVPLLDPASAVKQRNLVLSELDSDAGSPIVALLGDKHWEEPVTEDPKVGTTEVWQLINTTEDAHPIHLHLVQFQILNRQPFDVEQYPANLVFTEPPVEPPPNERPAWKDTVKVFPGEVTRIIAKFDLPTGTPVTPGTKFHYVWHCHILEHEDNDMMRPYDVVAD